MMKSIFAFSILALCLNSTAQDTNKLVTLYAMSPYFGPSGCEKVVQDKYGFTYSASSNLNDRQFNQKNKQARKELASIHGEAWYEEYLKEVKQCTELTKNKEH